MTEETPTKPKCLTGASVAAIALMLAACATVTNTQPASLYERLGGHDAIAAVVDDFVGNIAGDWRISHRFVNTDVPRLKALAKFKVPAKEKSELLAILGPMKPDIVNR